MNLEVEGGAYELTEGAVYIHFKRGRVVVRKAEMRWKQVSVLLSVVCAERFGFPFFHNNKAVGFDLGETCFSVVIQSNDFF